MGRTFKNSEIAAAFEELATLYELDGAVVYRVLAYRNAAKSIRESGVSVADMAAQGKAEELSGIGQTIAEKIAAMVQTGSIPAADKLKARIPPGLVQITRIPGLGPKRTRLLHSELGIDSLEALRAAAESGGLRHVKGLSERTEQNILEGIARIGRRSTRLLIHDADALIAGLLARLRDVRGVQRIEPAGSLRRRQPTIGDLDLLAAVDDPAAVIKALDGLPEVEKILSAGTDKSSIVLRDGPQVDLMVCPPAAWGTHLVHFTGNVDHNIALRGMALDRGWSLSEKGFKVIETGELLLDAEEAEVYERLGLPWIPPELRKGDGEIEAARDGKLPSLVTHADLRGDTHTHSDWTDGVDTIETMARAAREMGHEYIVLTDHSPSLGVARGLTPERVEEQRTEIGRLNAELAPFRILHGTELEIRADASLDYPDELLARFDVVIASIHTGRNQSGDQLTKRALAAIENPHVDVIAHPSGRIVNRRDPLPLDWPRVFEAAARTGTALEINGSPRLDLDDALARAAGRAGARLTVASDAHRTEELAQQRYAVDLARRAWLGADQLLATRTADELLEMLA